MSPAGRTVITVECFDEAGKKVHLSASTQAGERRVDAARIFAALDATESPLFRVVDGAVLHLPIVGVVAQFRAVAPLPEGRPGHSELRLWRVATEAETNCQVGIDERGCILRLGYFPKGCPMPGSRPVRTKGGESREG